MVQSPIAKVPRCCQFFQPEADLPEGPQQGQTFDHHNEIPEFNLSGAYVTHSVYHNFSPSGALIIS